MAHTIITQITLCNCVILCDDSSCPCMEKDYIPYIIAPSKSIYFFQFNIVPFSFSVPFHRNCDYLTLFVPLSLFRSLSFYRLLFPPLSLPGCLQHYANTFKGRLLLFRVILQQSCTPLMCRRGLRFLPNRSISGMTPAPRLNQGHTGNTHTQILTLNTSTHKY